ASSCNALRQGYTSSKSTRLTGSRKRVDQNCCRCGKCSSNNTAAATMVKIQITKPVRVQINLVLRYSQVNGASGLNNGNFNIQGRCQRNRPRVRCLSRCLRMSSA